MEEQKKDEGKKYKRVSLALLLLLVICLCAGGWLFYNSWQDDQNRLAKARDAQEGYLPGMTEKEIQKMLDDKVAEGSVQINMNSKLVFKDGKAKGYVRIVNSPNNHYKLVVEMIRRDTKETIYQTGAMDPGNYLEQDRLDVVLPKGDYPVSIHFKNYDAKSEAFVGEAVTENVVHILN